MPDKARITLLAYGSRGDVQPYLALAKGLSEAGYAVRMAAPASFEAFIREYGIDFAPLRGDPAELVASLVGRAGTSWWRIVSIVTQYALKVAVEVFADVRRACQGADAIIHSFLMTIVGHEIARLARIPDISALLYPLFSRTTAFPAPLFPALASSGRYNLISHDLTTQAYWQGSRLAYAYLRRKHRDLPPLSGWPFAVRDRQPPPILYGFSPVVIPPPQDWPEDVHTTGYWFLEPVKSWKPPEELLEFLTAGPPPVYIGFGSVITARAKDLTELIVVALRRAGRRGILSAGWGGFGTQQLPATVFPVGSAPHQWLFPKMAAVVHHGGAGTTAAGLRAGVPTVVVPFTSEQPYWGQRVHQLGAGPAPIRFRDLTVDRLARAIRTASSDAGIRERAAQLGVSIRNEDGVGQAVKLIDRHLHSA